MSDKIPPRIEITATLEVIAPIHIGDGGTRLLGFKKDEAPKSGATKDTPAPTSAEAGPPTVATVVRDGKDRPYLPSTTLKGFLRSLGEEIQQAAPADQPDTLTDKLFGRIKTSDPGADVPLGTMGALIVRGARMLKAGQTDGLPFTKGASVVDAGLYVKKVANDKKDGEAAEALEGEKAAKDDEHESVGLFIAARTRIDPTSGTAANSLLFHAEKVARGTTFELRLLLAPRNGASIDTLFTRLAEILASLSTNAGKPIGKGAAENSGRVRLVFDDKSHKKPPVIVKTLNEQGDWVADHNHKVYNVQALKAAQAHTPARPLVSHTLTLVCPGPCIVIDASRRAKRRAGEQDRSAAQIHPQSDAGTPLIDPAGIAGALRALSEWLDAIDRLRADQNSVSGGTLVRSRDDVRKLSRTERLFGATGFRGLLSVRVDTISTEQSQDFTSVKLDRLSGGPIDGALFTTRTFINTSLTLTLALDSRGPGRDDDASFPTMDDTAFVEVLVARLLKDGLKLGHGTNKGFGWFSVTNTGGRGA